MPPNDANQRSGGTQVDFPGGTGAAKAVGANDSSRKNGGGTVPVMSPPPSGNTAPKGGSGSYKGIPDGG